VDISIRSCLTAGVATITAAAVAFVPSVKEPVPAAAPRHVIQIASPPIKLTALVQPAVTSTNLPNLLGEWLQRIVVPPSAGRPFPTPQFPPVIGGTSIDSTIKNVYNGVEPWVQWGFDVAAYAVGWIPYVGWLAPQITIFYNFGERIARSITFNIADWLGGNVSFFQGLSNVGIDTINSFISLANDQLAFWLPPLPPIPPIGPLAATEATTELTVAATTPDVARTPRTPRQVLKALIDAPRNVVNGAVEAVEGATETTADESHTMVGRVRGPVREAAANIATTVTKRVTGTGTSVRKANDDTGTSVKKANDDTGTSVKKANDDTGTSVKKANDDKGGKKDGTGKKTK
jgi:hypothetical protein